MTCLFLLLFSTAINTISSDRDSNYIYMGEKFPVKYLVPDDAVPSRVDLNYYLNKLNSTVHYITAHPNQTNSNKPLGLFFMKCILKKTLIDDGYKFQIHELELIKGIIRRAENDLSHYIYLARNSTGTNDISFKMSLLYKDDGPQIHSIHNFNRNKLKRWILSKGDLNDYVESMDDLTLPREKYVKLVDTMNDYFMSIEESDECLRRIADNPEPIRVTQLQACRVDPFCTDRVYSSPSVAYALSHRFLNLLLRRTTRRCYIFKLEDDDRLMDILCAFMYREAVYIARRGFFSRDLFLEHVGLCSILGYEEFHRRNWFKKVASWIDNQGCITEDYNFEYNRTINYLKQVDHSKRKVAKMRKIRRNILEAECHEHPMILLTMVLAHGVRHAAHFMSNETDTLIDTDTIKTEL